MTIHDEEDDEGFLGLEQHITIMDAVLKDTLGNMGRTGRLIDEV